MAGMNSQALKDKMNQLEVIKVNLEAEISIVSSEVKQETVIEITEAQVREMIAEMKQYVMERNLPQCKQLIKDFVEEVIVYKDHVEVKFNMVFSNMKKEKGYNLIVHGRREDMGK